METHRLMQPLLAATQKNLLALPGNCSSLSAKWKRPVKN
jgi:hypothetical protein